MLLLNDLPRMMRAYNSLAEPKPSVPEFSEWWVKTEKVRTALRLVLERYTAYHDDPLIAHPLIADLEYIAEQFFVTPAMRLVSQYRRYPNMLEQHDPVDFEA